MAVTCGIALLWRHDLAYPATGRVLRRVDGCPRTKELVTPPITVDANKSLVGNAWVD